MLLSGTRCRCQLDDAGMSDTDCNCFYTNLSQLYRGERCQAGDSAIVHCGIYSGSEKTVTGVFVYCDSRN